MTSRDSVAADSASSTRRRGVGPAGTAGWAVLVLVVVLICVLTFISAPARHAHLHSTIGPDQQPPAVPDTVTSFPQSLHKQWSIAAGSPLHEDDTYVVDGLVIAAEEHRVYAFDPATESERWSYERSDATVCALSVAFAQVMVSFSTGFGCGETTAIDADTGRYKATRSVLTAEPVHSVRSNDAAGVYNDELVVLWRSDLVRTIQVGTDPAPQEREQLGTEYCRIGSALTRLSSLALVDVCAPGEADNETGQLLARLHFFDRNPEDSRKPEPEETIELEQPDAQLLAIAKEAAAVYYPPLEPGAQGRIVSYGHDGSVLSERSVPALSDPHDLIHADLPHHVTVHTDRGLILFHPTTLAVEHIFADAIGSGVALGSDAVAYPVRDGLALAEWGSGERIGHVRASIDDGADSTPINLRLAGDTIIAKQGSTITGWRR
ncbi:hypothetical protein CCICO_08875 [Corynebacterium ciconiae DSM 44920]|uniref:Rv3212 family protein n=1 Tax=Corynebacterium ciconiae TaxID=227319 RepID=UPI0003600742|nr:PQQ-binding-like beta-propeller repeat protein [Corynebacterium ciconiae]WKD61783.1 hypothetical protein CCICO_08875 [Corynebacterium ciconiae DSM 44920]